jgi:hypothetical protein
MYVSYKQDDWDIYLNACLFSYRVSIQSSARFTPFELMHGRVPRLPLDATLALGSVKWAEERVRTSATAQKPNAEADAKFLQQLVEKLEVLRAQSKEYIQTTQWKAAARLEAGGAVRPSFSAGDLVLLWTPLVPRGHVNKLTLKWSGPYRVLEVLGDFNYRIEAMDEKGKVKIVTANADRLRPFMDNEAEFEDMGEMDDQGREAWLRRHQEQLRTIDKLFDIPVRASAAEVEEAAKVSVKVSDVKVSAVPLVDGGIGSVIADVASTQSTLAGGESKVGQDAVQISAGSGERLRVLQKDMVDVPMSVQGDSMEVLTRAPNVPPLAKAKEQRRSGRPRVPSSRYQL